MDGKPVIDFALECILPHSHFVLRHRAASL
jgi:hypothetical protein